MQIVRKTHLAVAWAFVAGVVVQVFLAGLGVFDGPERFETHVGWGYLLEIVPLAMLVFALLGRLGTRAAALALGLFGMFILQSVFVAVRADLPMVAALHPVNGFAILLVGIVNARLAWAERNVRAGVPAASPAPAVSASVR